MKLSRYILLPLLLFFSLVSNAQSNLQNSSFTDPTSNDLHLVNKALSSCEVLQEVVGGIEDTDNLSSNELFQRLQKVDSDGNLLIENKACSEDILEFVSSLCSSDSGTNRLFCSRLGFEQVSGTGGVSTDSYKSFGSVALGDLGDSDFEVSSTSGVSTLSNDDNKSTFSIAGVLFAFTPVKRLKLASSFVRSRAVVSRPVLNGAMLILATLGLASCGDVTEPVAPKPVAPKPPDTPCTRGESGYFQLTNSASDCIKLINPPVISYLDEEGNVITDTSTITNHSIKVTFEEPVSFIDASEQGSLTSDNITKMVDVKLGSIDLLDVGFDFTIEIESNESSFTLTPETNYSAGDYTVGVSNYAKKADVSKIASSSNRSQYLSRVNSMSQSLSSFTAPVVPTFCTRNEEGYFELTNDNLTTSCIKLPEASFTFTQDGKTFSDEHSGEPATIIRIEFDSKIIYIEGGVSNDLTKSNILEMIQITNSSGVDLTGENGSIGEAQVSFTVSDTESDSSTVITINPPNDNKYELGQYMFSLGNFAKSDDANSILASNNAGAYLSSISKEQSFNIQTPCGRGEAGYFELTDEDGTGDCIKLIDPPTVTYLDKDDNTIQDTSTISDHKIKVTFDGRVSFIDSDRYEGLTATFARNMIELNTNNTNLLTDTFRFSIEADVDEDENSFFILTPGASYPAGGYSVKVKNYVNSSDASKVLSATNTDSYLALINQEHSSFSTPNISTLCESNASGYFELTNSDGSKNCIRVPHVVFTFTPKNGEEMIESDFDPTAVIKIYFDSEVVYLKEDGTYRDITKEDILEMIEIMVRDDYIYYVRDRSDLVKTSGPLGMDLVSVSHTGGKTVIAIESPYDPITWDGKIYQNSVPYSLIVKNFAKKSDVSKIAGSSFINSYLDDTKTFYDGEFGARYYNATSCDIEHRPSAASYDRYYDQHSDTELDSFVCDTGKVRATFLPPSEDIAFDTSMAHGAGVTNRLTDKADPGTRYVIDIAFVIADSLLENASGDWKGYLKNTILKHVNKMFQDSGVNVEFRASVISPFSEYRQYLLCDLPALDNLVITQKKDGDSYGIAWDTGEAIAMLEIIPGIRKRHSADIFIAVLPGGGGYASGSLGFEPAVVTSRWESFAVMGIHNESFNIINGLTGLRLGYTRTISYVLAHEIGHVLGLHHDVDTILNSGLSLDMLGRPGLTATGFGYGYGGSLNDLPVATIMSYSGAGQGIDLFSSDKEVLGFDLCSDEESLDNIIGFGGYCNGDNYQPDEMVRIGGYYKGILADSTEALQYTIHLASEFSDIGVAPLDLSTVTNAVTAKALRSY